MNEEKFENLIRNADANAEQPSPVKVDISAIRKRAHHRRIYRIVYPAAAAAIVIFAVCVGTLFNNNTVPVKDPTMLAKEIETRIKLHSESIDKALNLIQEIREQEQGQKRLNELKIELASYRDPIEQVNEELDRTAFILVYSADKMYKELNLTDSAVETYKRVIKLFPDNQWAQEARNRLEEIKKRNNNDSSKGKSEWKQQNTIS